MTHEVSNRGNKPLPFHHGFLLFTAICLLVLGAGVLSHPWNVLCVYALATGLGLMYGATYLLTRRRPEVDYSTWGTTPERRGVKP